MQFTAYDILLAWLLDAVLGDPRWLPWPHPVVLIGRGVSFLKGRLYNDRCPPEILVWRGFLLWGGTVGGATLAAWTLLALAAWLNPLAGRAVGVYLAYACLATRCLDAEARSVGRLLKASNLEQARSRLSGIVGRDTQSLDPPEIVRACVETVAENSSDGVVAPLLYLAVGASLGWGPLLGLIYKAVNTLDSMVGYRDQRHEQIGKASAIADDLANWIPARLTVVATAAAAHVLWRRGRECLEVALRDGHLHTSPNAGYPEAAYAGALGVALGGTNTYCGVSRPSPRIGDPGPPLETAHIHRSLQLLWGGSAVALLGAAGCVSLF